MSEILREHFWACWWLVIIVVIGAGNIIDNMWANHCLTRTTHDQA